MAILNADCLLEHAEELAFSEAVGQRLQIDLRRSISASYYALFHTIATTAAQQALTGGSASQTELSLAIRAITHTGIKRVCVDLNKSSIAPPYASYLPTGGFTAELRSFMTAFPILQEERHRADYDILPTYTRGIAIGTVAIAVQAKAAFWRAKDDERRAFLLLILFPPRR